MGKKGNPTELAIFYLFWDCFFPLKEKREQRRSLQRISGTCSAQARSLQENTNSRTDPSGQWWILVFSSFSYSNSVLLLVAAKVLPKLRAFGCVSTRHWLGLRWELGSLRSYLFRAPVSAQSIGSGWPPSIELSPPPPPPPPDHPNPNFCPAKSCGNG